jgi:putative FmdB family regulatory protein
MPIYAYRCTQCGHALDALRKISDPALTVCPACGLPTLVKQVTAAGFQLKGSGWYVTDFRGDKKAAGKATEGEAAGKTGDANGDAAPANDAAKSGEAAKAGATGEGAGKAEPAPAAAPAASAPAAAPAPAAPGKSGA